MLSTARTELLARAILRDAPPDPAEQMRIEAARLDRLDRAADARVHVGRRSGRLARLRWHRHAEA